MRKNKLFLSLLMVMLLSVGNVWADEVTFAFGDYKGEGTSSSGSAYTMSDKDDVTIGDTKFYGNNSYAHFYANGVTTITPASGVTITQIVLTASSSSYNGYQSSGTMTWSTGSSSASGAVVTWTGSATAAFTLSHNKQIRWTSIVVTYSKESGGTPTCATPTFSPAAGSYEGTQNVTISSTAGSTIYYTTDGSTPTASSSVYSSPIAVSADMTIKAYAVKADYEDSEVATAAYTITEGPDVTLDFTTNDSWGLPTTNTLDEKSYTSGGYTISIAGAGSGNGFKFSTNYLILGKSGAYIILPQFSSPVEKIVVVGNSGGSGSVVFNIFDGNTPVSTAVTGCTTDKTFEIEDPAVNKQYTLKVTSAHNLQLKAIKIYFGEAPEVAKPTISGEDNFVGSTSVSISHADADAIYYTTNGSTPTTSSALYSAPFSLTNTATVKAIAVKGGVSSDVAEKTFTKVEALTTMDAIFAAATTAGSTATDKYITFNNWVVTGVKNSNVYVTDGTKGFIIYTSSHGFNVGDILSGTAACKVQLYNGSAELTELTASKVTVNTGGSVSPVVLDAAGIEALTGANTGSVIKISGECTYESSKYYIAGVQLYNQLYSFSVSAGTNYECTGVYVLNTSYGNEILPRSAADIVAQTSVANPTFSPAAGEYTEVQNVTLSCATDGATVYYTTDGTNPTNESTVYSSAIEVGASMTIKAIAYKGEDHSEVVSAAYTINIPLPSHDFQVTHHFSTGEGFEFPTGWGGSYAEHEIAYTDDKVHFASASKQSGTITDRPVVKEGAVSLILTNSSKLISAVRFDYSQWSDKVPTFTMKYSTDGGETYNNFDPVVSSTDFALQVLDLPENVNAIQVVGTANKQTGLTSIAFDLVDKPVVTKTVTITTPTNGTLTVMNGESAVTSGAAVEEGSVLTITATPAEGYKLTEVTVNGSAYTASTLTLTENVTIAASFEVNQAPLVTSYVLSEIGVETSHLNAERVGDKVNLPLTAATCSKTFVGWDPASNCSSAPTYAPGAEYTLAANNKLYAVYADPVAGSTWDVATSVAAGDVVVISTNTGYTAHDMKTAGAISGTLLGCTASTYNTDKSQITELAEGTLQFTVGGNATNGWTLKNGTKYLAATAAKKVALQDNEATWSIEFSGNTATVTYSTTTYGRLQYNYNSGSDRFTTYATDQTAISLYKQAVSYNNYSTACAAAPATLESIAISGTATELEYTDGQHFNPAGLVVTGTYSDASTAPITEGIDWTFDPDPLTEGTTSVSVTATVESINSQAYVVNGLTVGAPTPAGDNYVKVTASQTDWSGDYLLVYEDGTNAYVWNGDYSDGASNYASATISSNTIAKPDAAAVITIAAASDGKYTLQVNGDKYFQDNGSNSKLIFTDAIADAAEVTISYETDWTKLLFSQRCIRFNNNSGQTRFRFYAADSQQPIQLYKKESVEPVEPELNYVEARAGLTVGKFYTICMPRNILGVRGATFWNLNNRDESGSMVYFEEAEASLDAGKPYIFIATATTLEVAYGEDVAGSPVPNGALRGTFSEMTQSDFNTISAANSGSPIYMLVNNQLRQVVGRSGNSLGANRAYVIYNELQAGEPTPAPGRRVLAMPMNENVATGIDALGSDAQPSKIIVNGQLFIIRDGKAYDATGRQVSKF